MYERPITNRQLSLWTDIVTVDSFVSKKSNKLTLSSSTTDKQDQQHSKGLNLRSQLLVPTATVLKWLFNLCYFISGNISWTLWIPCFTACCNTICGSETNVEIFRQSCVILNHMITPIAIIFIFDYVSFFSDNDTIIDNKFEIQSWEISICVWGVCLGLYAFCVQLYPLIKYISINKSDDNKSLIFQSKKYLSKLSRWKYKGDSYLLLPFGIYLSKIQLFENNNVYWPIVLVSIFPSAIIGYAYNFSIDETYNLKCGDGYKNNQKSVLFNGEYCIFVSNWQEWYLYFFPSVFGGALAIWAGIKIIATFLLYFGPDTQIFNEAREIGKIKQKMNHLIVNYGKTLVLLNKQVQNIKKASNLNEYNDRDADHEEKTSTILLRHRNNGTLNNSATHSNKQNNTSNNGIDLELAKLLQGIESNLEKELETRAINAQHMLDIAVDKQKNEFAFSFVNINSKDGDAAVIHSTSNSNPKSQDEATSDDCCFCCGCCCSAGVADNARVQRELDMALQRDARETKVLFLGAGGSGKTTIFKQLQYIHGDGFGDADRQKFQAPIWEQIIDGLQTMIQVLTDDNNEYNVFVGEKERENTKINPDLQNSIDYFLGMDGKSGVEVSNILADHVKKLWNDPAIQKVYSNQLRAVLLIQQDIDRVFDKNYIPTDDDLILVRYRTLGMTEKIFKFEETKEKAGGDKLVIKHVDVGGQRNERRKWMHFFDNVGAVIFVASLSAYDEIIFEDPDTNAMHEALEVFREQINNEIFAQIPFILFLNKYDLFVEKINDNISIIEAFPDYNGQHDVEACYSYIKQQFEKQCRDKSRKIHTFRTIATKRDDVEKTFGDVRRILISQALERAGIILKEHNESRTQQCNQHDADVDLILVKDVENTKNAVDQRLTDDHEVYIGIDKITSNINANPNDADVYYANKMHIGTQLQNISSIDHEEVKLDDASNYQDFQSRQSRLNTITMQSVSLSHRGLPRPPLDIENE